MDHIIIKNLRCGCHIGCKEEERALLQVLFITIDLSIDSKPAATTDDLEKTVNYAKLNKAIIQLCQTSTCHLIETLAQNIADFCLQNPIVQAVGVEILKPAGIPNADGAIISIQRQR